MLRSQTARKMNSSRVTGPAGSKQAYASLWHIEHLVSCIVESSAAESLSSAPSRDLSVGVGGAVPTSAAIVLDPDTSNILGQVITQLPKRHTVWGPKSSLHYVAPRGTRLQAT
jgi:hypothetical protein